MDLMHNLTLVFSSYSAKLTAPIFPVPPIPYQTTSNFNNLIEHLLILKHVFICLFQEYVCAFMFCSVDTSLRRILHDGPTKMMQQQNCFN